MKENEAMQLDELIFKNVEDTGIFRFTLGDLNMQTKSYTLAEKC